ncbi:MAG: LLM class flavin-dependent oxidoreductase [Acidimicrobiales bacterium]|jgi:5,10-methylenetetrahydromethanopterin reductase
MQFGMMIGFEKSIAAQVDLAQRAEAAGIDSLWMVEAQRSASVPLTAVAAATSSIGLGTYVVNAYARSPWLTGIVARDLDEVSNGRMTLGIGTGNVHMNEWHQGLDSSRPLAKMRDYIEIVKAIVSAPAGGKVRHDGPVHQSRWTATHEPVRPTIPVYMSGSGPRMISLAAEVSDGVGTGIMASPEHMRDLVRPVASAAAASVGRSASDLAFPSGAWISANENRAAARAAARFAVVGLYHPVPHPYYDRQLRQQGFAEVADMAAELMPAGRTREAMDRVPDEVVDALTVAGTPEECAARLDDYAVVADQVVALRVPQRHDSGEPSDYDALFQVAGHRR